MKKLQLQIFVSCLLLIGCSNSGNGFVGTNNVTIGQKILFPENVFCTEFGESTEKSICSELLSKEMKILLFVDSFGCTDCRLKLSFWNLYIEDSRKHFEEKVGFLFFFQPKVGVDLRNLFELYAFNYPVFIDRENKFATLNKLTVEGRTLCLLLNDKNEVIAIGNPTSDPKVWNNYKSLIKSSLQRERQILN